MRRLSLILFVVGLCGSICRSARAEGFVSPLINLILLPHEPPDSDEAAPYTKVFNRGAYFYFPSVSSPEGAQLRWAEPVDPDSRSLFGRGQILPLSPRQRARAFELSKLLGKEGVTSAEDFPFLIPYPRKPGTVLDNPHRNTDRFREKNGGEIGAAWVAVRVNLGVDGIPVNSSLLFQYRDERQEDKTAYLPLDFDVEKLPVRSYPQIDLSVPSDCYFGLDLGEGLKGVRVLGFATDGVSIFVSYEEHLRMAKRNPGLVRVFLVPFASLRALPAGSEEQRRSQYDVWSRRQTTENEMRLLHNMRSPLIIPVQVPRNWDETAFHLYLAATAERNAQMLMGQYKVYTFLEAVRRHWSTCRTAVAEAGERLISAFFRKTGG
ncbi:MAG: hypothetical protein R3B54_13545 [Bdellovibrionota bacterium]